MKVIRRLLDYSLIESHQDAKSYSIHPVVYDWCRESIDRDNVDLTVLALTVVGYAVPGKSEPEYWVLQQRLLPHANRCIQYFFSIEISKSAEDQDCNDSFFNLGFLYANQGKMAEAEKMYERALSGREKAWGLEHTSTLDTVNNLGVLYADQSKMTEAEKMYERALDGYVKSMGPDHPRTIVIRGNLDILKEGSKSRQPIPSKRKADYNFRTSAKKADVKGRTGEAKRRESLSRRSRKKRQ